jgi:hypothetical protein
MSQEDYDEECRQLALANGNHRLYRLKKEDLLKVCAHYGVNIFKNPGSNSRTTAVKGVLEARIIEHRDVVYDNDATSVVSPLNTDLPRRREEMVCIIRKVINDYNMSFTNHTFDGYHSVRFRNDKVMREPKINLAIMLLMLTKIDNYEDFRGRLETITNEQILNIYRSQDYAHRNAYYDAIRVKIISLKNKTEDFQEAERERREANERDVLRRTGDGQEKKIKVMNETHQTIYLYWYYMREGDPDRAVCKCFGPIPVGHDYNIKYRYDYTHIITTRSDRGNECYYRDIKDYMISDNAVTDKDPITNKLVISQAKTEIEMWKEAALKCDFLMKELKRLGIEKYETMACIVDMHQDIVIPQHSERDKDVAGIPSTFTNVT